MPNRSQIPDNIRLYPVCSIRSPVGNVIREFKWFRIMFHDNIPSAWPLVVACFLRVVQC